MNSINESIKKNEFQNELKAEDITLIFKKEDLLNKENYRSVSVLPTISIIFERVLFDQEYYYLRGSRKGYDTQYALVNLLQKWKKCLYEPDGIVDALLMDLSKAYDCVNHELIIAKLAAYKLNEYSQN